MSKRLQVVLEESDYREIRQTARRQHMTVSEWVRQSLRIARREQPAADVDRKLAVVRTAAANSFPTADMPQMLEEIERGYLADPPG